jgi:EpsI family protein
MIKLVAALLFLSLDFYVYHYMATEKVVPPRTSFDSFPLELGAWHCGERDEMDAEALDTLRVTDYFLCTYRRREPRRARADVYVGYHESQVREEGGGGEASVIHPPEHCLPGAGWDIIDSRVVPLELAGLPESGGIRAGQPEAKRFVIAKGDARALVYFWYQSRGRVLARNEEVILLRFWDRATRQRTDGSLIRFSVPIVREDVDAAEASFRDLASRIVPLLPDYIPN